MRVFFSTTRTYSLDRYKIRSRNREIEDNIREKKADLVVDQTFIHVGHLEVDHFALRERERPRVRDFYKKMKPLKGKFLEGKQDSTHYVSFITSQVLLWDVLLIMNHFLK